MNLVNMHFLTSWDDGNILDLKVATLLQKYNLPGTFYIVGDLIGKKDGLRGKDRVNWFGFDGFWFLVSSF